MAKAFEDPPAYYPSAPEMPGQGPIQSQPPASHHYQYQPVPQQPIPPQQINVVLQQPQPKPKIFVEPANFPLPRAWSSEVCGCCDDVGNCLLTCFCGPCMLCHVSLLWLWFYVKCTSTFLRSFRPLTRWASQWWLCAALQRLCWQWGLRRESCMASKAVFVMTAASPLSVLLVPSAKCKSSSNIALSCLKLIRKREGAHILICHLFQRQSPCIFSIIYFHTKASPKWFMINRNPLEWSLASMSSQSAVRD